MHASVARTRLSSRSQQRVRAHSLTCRAPQQPPSSSTSVICGPCVCARAHADLDLKTIILELLQTYSTGDADNDLHELHKLLAPSPVATATLDAASAPGDSAEGATAGNEHTKVDVIMCEPCDDGEAVADDDEEAIEDDDGDDMPSNAWQPLGPPLPSEPNMPGLCMGTLVVVDGLVAVPEFNGRSGRAVRWFDDLGRCACGNGS